MDDFRSAKFPFTLFDGGFVDAEIGHLVGQNPTCDAEMSGCLGFIPITFLQRVEDHETLELLHRFDEILARDV